MCDVIPGVVASFRGALGALDRPFAIPGDVGQQLTLTLGACDGASPGFVDLPGGSDLEDDYFVTVLFEPPSPGASNAVVITTSANGLACQAAATAALGELGGGAADCLAVGAGTREYTIADAARLSFRFPDTDPQVGAMFDDRTYTGPATIAVTPVGAPLPFSLASARCAASAGLVACVDELYAPNGTCDTTTASVDPVFGHFSGLPPANDYEALVGAPGELRFTVDAEGNALIPVDWRGVLLRPDGLPVPRLVSGDTSLEAFAGGGIPVRVPGTSFLASYSPGGLKLPPIFVPVADPAAVGSLALFGTVERLVRDVESPGRSAAGGTLGGGCHRRGGR